MIDFQNVSRVYQIGREKVYALNGATFHVNMGEFVSVIGPSGSGKSTLMNIVGCLDIADGGTYLLDGIPIDDYTENELAEIHPIYCHRLKTEIYFLRIDKGNRLGYYEK